MIDYVFKLILGTVSICGLTAATGVFAFLRKQSLVGDALAHAILPGVCIGYLVAGTKNPWFLLIGATFAGLTALFLINYLEKKKIKSDASIAFVMVVFFAFGSVLLNYIQQQNSGELTGLENYLFGQLAGITDQDLQLYAIFGIVISCLILTFFNVNKWILFDPQHAKVLGLSVKFFYAGIAICTVIVVSLGIQSVGIVLISALLLTPAAAARFWTFSLKKLFVLSTFFGIISGLAGVWTSFSYPGIPTGPIIVLFLFLIVLISILFSKNGLISRYLSAKKFQQKIAKENILKVFFHLFEIGKKQISIVDIMFKRKFESSELAYYLVKLEKDGFIVHDVTSYALTKSGREEAARIVRLHRLWEIYLSQRMNLKDDHIHPNAESIEHIITAELEIELLKELDYPLQDPHDRSIPY